MLNNRSSGIILHPTSLPGPDGIGDLGPEASRWVDFLYETGCGLWQVLPLGPTGFGDSPYQCFSAFAGNPLLISPALLLEDNLLTLDDLIDRPDLPDDFVSFSDVIHWKNLVIERAINRFRNSAARELKDEYFNFLDKEKFWLDDYALFMSIKKSQNGTAWKTWPKKLRSRDPNTIKNFKLQHSSSIDANKIIQFLFFHQWYQLKKYANERGIKIIGDVPIFIAYDSADSWTHPELFTIDENGQLTFVAGVPPDYFSETGQLWGNPLYQWDVHRADDYAWWTKRINSALQLFDMIRLDHFRGFAGYWKIPAGMPTAEIGTWEKGPGNEFFDALSQKLGEIPIIAEDLGVITPDVVAMRENFQFPGMKIFQFAFSTDSTDTFLPHNYPANCVVYSGTHDNDTALGWYRSAPEHEKDFCRRYLGRSGDDISWDMIRAIWSSIAIMSLAPFQDILSLGSEARMNYPGKPSGNWTWRFTPDVINNHLVNRLREYNILYNRYQSDQTKS